MPTVVSVGRVREIWRYPVKSMAGERLEAADLGENGLWGDRAWALRDDATGEICNAKRHPVLMRCAVTYREAPRPDRVPHVAITLPDGTSVGSDSPSASRLLSELIGRAVTLRPVQPAADVDFYRRRDAGAALLARLWAYRRARRLLQRLLFRGSVARTLREAFGREPDDPLPDLSDVPATVWKFHTPPGTYFDLAPIHLLTTSALDRVARANPAAAWDVRRFRPNVVVDTGGAGGAVESAWVGRTIRFGDCAVRGELLTVRCAMTMHPQAGLPRDPSVLRTIVREANQCLGLYASVVESGRIGVGGPVEV